MGRASEGDGNGGCVDCAVGIDSGWDGSLGSELELELELEKGQRPIATDVVKLVLV